MKNWNALLLALSLAPLVPAAAHACDFCMLGQGVSPYLSATGKGVTLGVNYVEHDKVYNRTQNIDSEGKQEAWLIYSVTGFYPLTDDLTLLVNLPYVSKTNVDLDDATGLNTGTLTTGVGDSTLTGRYTLFKSHAFDSTLIGGLLGGVKLPTGSTKSTDHAGNTVDRHALPGTGSWDFDLGFSGAYTAASGFQLTLDGVYRISGSGKWGDHAHRFGNMFNYGAKAFYRVAKTEAGASFMPFLGSSGETIGEEKGAKDPTSGDYDSNLVNPSTGGTVLFVDIGLYAILSPTTSMNVGFAKAYYHSMGFDPAFEADPAENYKIDLAITYLF